MENAENCREHYNLYYIFASDKQEHSLPVDKKDEIWQNICKIFSKS